MTDLPADPLRPRCRTLVPVTPAPGRTVEVPGIPVTEARLSREATDPAVGRRLWAAAEDLTGVTYP
ncbi:hypothetical protein GCM10029963_77930 [Micromonospora andamanensis]